MHTSQPQPRRALRVSPIYQVHTVTFPEGNDALWCNTATSICNDENERLIFAAWDILARRYCRFPNVILADVFNEPHGASWPPWAKFVERIGAAILGRCPRWLIVAQGIGGDGWIWGENVQGFSTMPIALPVPDRLVISVHIYGHFRFGYLMWDPRFPCMHAQRIDPTVPRDRNPVARFYARAPTLARSCLLRQLTARVILFGLPRERTDNLPAIWDAHFNWVRGPPHTVPVLVGECARHDSFATASRLGDLFESLVGVRVG
jgi:hypothetical protein